MKTEIQIKPISVGILMIIYTSIVFFCTMPVYWLMLIFSFFLAAVVKKRKSIQLFAFYIILFGLINIVPSEYFLYGWFGEIYTMVLIIIKMFTLWIFSGIMYDFITSTMI